MEEKKELDEKIHVLEEKEKTIDSSIMTNINNVKILDNIQMEIKKLNKKMEYFLDTYSKAMDGPSVKANKENLYTTSSIVSKRYNERITDKIDSSLKAIKELRSQKETLSKEKESLLDDNK